MRLGSVTIEDCQTDFAAITVTAMDASITVPVSGNNARVYALDSTGRRKQEMATTMDDSGANASSISFNPKLGRTIWFEVVSKDGL